MNISVVIPVYNAERFIEKAVKSACEQGEVMEVLLIEDGSTDNSLSICKELVRTWQPVVKLFRCNDKNSRSASAPRNCGIEKSKGKFIAFLDADDYYLPGRFINDLNILNSNPDIDGVYNALGVEIYDHQERKRINYSLTTVDYLIPPDILFEKMRPNGTAGYFSGNTLTVRKNVFRKVGLFDTNLELSEDTHMWIKMASKVSLVAGIIDRPVAVRGVHEGNRVKDIAKLYYFRHLMYLSLLEWGKEKNIHDSRMNILWNSLYTIFDRTQNTDNITKHDIKKRVFFYLLKYGITNPSILFDINFYSSFACLMKL